MPVSQVVVVPRPPTCTLCSAINCELPSLSTFIGCDFHVMNCSGNCSTFTYSKPDLYSTPSVLPECVVPDSQGGFVFYPPIAIPVKSRSTIHLLADKDSVRTLLMARPANGFCAFLSTRTASGMHTWFKGASLVRQYESSHPVSLNANDKKPSKILVYYLRPPS